MNEILFILHVIFISSSLLLALKYGKEALVILICLLWVLANLFVTKQITLFGLNATASDALSVGAILGFNLLQEYYGKSIAQKTIWLGFAVTLLYTVLTQLHIAYIPSACDTSHEHFYILLQCMPRIIFASLITYLIVQQLDYRLYAFLRQRYNNFFIVRNYCSIIICQLLDTVLFSFLGLYGIVDHIGNIIIISYCIKLATLVLSTPFLLLSKHIKTS